MIYGCGFCIVPWQLYTRYDNSVSWRPDTVIFWRAVESADSTACCAILARRASGTARCAWSGVASWYAVEYAPEDAYQDARIMVWRGVWRPLWRVLWRANARIGAWLCTRLYSYRGRATAPEDRRVLWRPGVALC